MSRDDMEQLEYIENWKKKQQEKAIRKENKEANIRMHYARCKEYFKLGFVCLFSCVKEIFKR
jgi:hypothetical protein